MLLGNLGVWKEGKIEWVRSLNARSNNKYLTEERKGRKDDKGEVIKEKRKLKKYNIQIWLQVPPQEMLWFTPHYPIL